MYKYCNMINAKFLRADYAASVRSDMTVVDPTVSKEQMRMFLKDRVFPSMGFWNSLDVLILIISF